MIPWNERSNSRKLAEVIVVGLSRRGRVEAAPPSSSVPVHLEHSPSRSRARALLLPMTMTTRTVGELAGARHEQ